MNIYSDKSAHVQVIINCRYSVAQMCTPEDTFGHYVGTPSLDDVMSQNELTTSIAPSRVLSAPGKICSPTIKARCLYTTHVILIILGCQHTPSKVLNAPAKICSPI